MKTKTIKAKKIIAKKILKWHKQNGRHDLPWVGVTDPTGYAVFVSEVMMQQTTVSVGKIRFPEFIKKFPSWSDLASATPDEVMKAWEGLGYYRRARFLHEAAKKITENHAGQLPVSRLERLALPSVGKSTASALGSFVFGFKEPIWDANVARVFRRLFGSEVPEKEKLLWEWQEKHHKGMIDDGSEKTWPQALMDFGSIVCTPKNPKCSTCPLQKDCWYANQNSATTPESDLKKPIRQTVWRHWGVFTKDGLIALKPPKEKGIWSGLWEFPELSVENIVSQDVLASGSHSLSHRTVLWRVLETSSVNFSVLDTSSWHFVTLSELNKLAFPKPLADFLISPLFKKISKKIVA